MVVGGLGLLVVVGWLFFGSGCELCCLWCFFVVVVCIILL